MPSLKVELAKSGRSKCTNNACKEVIEKGELRVGTGVMIPPSEELSYKWRHVCCFTARQIANTTKNAKDDLEGYSEMTAADKKVLDAMMAGKLIDDTSVRGNTGTLAKKGSPKKRSKGNPRKSRQAQGCRRARAEEKSEACRQKGIPRQEGVTEEKGD